MVLIPVFQNISSKFIMQIKLNEINYKLRFFWNTREECWYMSILTKEDVELATGLKIVQNYLLTMQFRAYEDRLPEGHFVVLDLENRTDGEITFDNFGSRYQLVYVTYDELEEGGLL